MSRGALVFTALIATASCAYLMPATWRAFDTDIDTVKAAVYKTLKAKGLEILAEKTADTPTSPAQNQRIVTEWRYHNSDTLTRHRQRYIIRWENDQREKSIVLYVRHEQEDIEARLGESVVYSAPYPNSAQETDLIEQITEHILNSRP